MAEITTKLIQELRAKTGIGMMDCKNALVEAKGNIEKAIEVLRKKGAKVAAKRSGKEANHGIIHSYIHAGAKLGVLVEINCETDFSAKTPAMLAFAKDICMQIAAANPLCINVEDLDSSIAEKELEIIKAQLKKDKKPENLIEKIAKNKLEKFYETACLLKQKYVKNDKITIQDHLNELVAKIGENIKIKRFTRYLLGE
jgi:elongation factor Ts